MRRGFSPAPAIRAGGLLIDHEQPLVEGLVATDGVQYSTEGTITNSLTTGWSKKIDFGFDIKPLLLEAILTARFTNVLNNVVSLSFYWQAKKSTPSLAWINISPSINIPVGTQATNTFEHTFIGNVPVATITELPIDLRLAGLGTAGGCTVAIKNNSTIRFVGSVIP